MKSPLDAIESRIEQIADEVERRVQVAILRESVKVSLSRLATLDLERSAAYLAAIEAMQ